MLVKGGANANLPDRHGRTAVHLAVEAKDIGSLQALTHANNPKLNLEIRNFEGKLVPGCCWVFCLDGTCLSEVVRHSKWLDILFW